MVLRVTRIRELVSVAVLSVSLASGCASVARISPSSSNTPTITSIPPTSTATPTVKLQATSTEVAKASSATTNPSSIVSPSKWATYTDPQLKVTLGYPADWQKDDSGNAIYSSIDGFFQLSAVGSGAQTADETCAYEMEANNARKYQRYGTTPKLEYLKIEGQAACLILPSEDQAKAQRDVAFLAIQYPESLAPQPYILLLFADKDHIRQIGQTVKFAH
jgi:hypothetical protein